ncbi:small, acid-soluble spore protein, alpha/beta type [Clostridiisalibacter paucivorans]|uniref:small, acid-soluble spore protein, alpha/beta type n=1 Tax=Clostridiisalibacter paucivorans TaxID=408753 RepID=UPI000A078F14|nr:small, acid-soluble spore protein, alpha/beta type [Clostridiisalibacter paucivorans]
MPKKDVGSMKYEIAKELGLMDKIKEVGWGGLTAKETGKIGGKITVKKREARKKKKDC